MPIKVRCKECNTSFSVKDEAEGKRVRCKGCGAPVKVSAAQSKKKRTSSGKSEDTDDFLASFDINKIEDKDSKICPRCGYDVNEEDIECPKCGVELSTGRMREATRRKRGRRGPAVEDFYSKSWGDAYKFLGNHKGLAVKTFLYSSIASTLFFCAVFMMFWCHRTPPRGFWAFIAFVSIMAVPGWIWFIQTEVVRFALQKKDKLKRINFDFFLCSALGIKFISWLVLFSLPAQAVFGSVGYYYISNGSTLVGVILIAVGFIPTFLMFPLAIPHMTMADSSPGWMLHKLGKVFLVLFKPAIFWCFVFLITNLPAIGCLAAIGAVYGNDLDTFFSNVRYNSAVAADDQAKADAEENKIKDFQEGELAGKEPRVLEPGVLIVPSILWALACLFYAPAMIFNARVNGLLAVHCKPDLDLVTKIDEVKYVSKAERAQGAATPRWQQAVIAVVGGVVIGLVIYFLASMLPKLLLYVFLGIASLAQLVCFFVTLTKIFKNEGPGQCAVGFFISIYAYAMGWVYAGKDKEMGKTMITWTLSIIVLNSIIYTMLDYGMIEPEQSKPAAEAPAAAAPPAEPAAP
tara:strand:+ start:1716 stop:3437 length:1722 start_codon:yes stop_codon:yes gene_type:complete